ncbi:2 6-beta-D-fructofuranosidase [Phocaeicola dorei CAG:222]|nr:2 6-beta-D-fructofuranosidase [Phocaeicola dorei CAG:222]
MNKNQQKNRMGAVIILLAAVCLNGYAQQDSTKVASNSKEEGNRNVMLNAASANGPREISIITATAIGCPMLPPVHHLFM